MIGDLNVYLIELCRGAIFSSRGHRDRKKISGVDFFANSSLGGLTNYVIRHQPKYGNMTSPTLALHALFGRNDVDIFVAQLEKGRRNGNGASPLPRHRSKIVSVTVEFHFQLAQGRKKVDVITFERHCKAQILKTS